MEPLKLVVHFVQLNYLFSYSFLLPQPIKEDDAICAIELSFVVWLLNKFSQVK